MNGEDNPVIAMFRWWNDAYEADDFTAAGFARFFTEDLEFSVNGNLRARTCAVLAESFQRIRATTLAVRLCLPVMECFAAGDKIFVHYRVEATTEDGDMVEQAMAYATIENGLIRRMTVLNHENPAG